MTKDKQPQSNVFLNFFDTVYCKFAKTHMINPKTLVTENRNDILLRKDFLHNVIDENKLPIQTLYYQFISDGDRGITRDPIKSSKSFLELFKDIKLDGIKTPLLIGKYDSTTLDTRYILCTSKYWKNYRNVSGFQLIDGAHRLAIALYLKLDTIPVKIISTRGFQIPDYTEFLKLKSKEYLENIE